MTPTMLPFSSLTKSINYALFNALAGLKEGGIFYLFPTVAVRTALSNNLESLKEPSS
jgi:hypothetical protein